MMVPRKFGVSWIAADVEYEEVISTDFHLPLPSSLSRNIRLVNVIFGKNTGLVFFFNDLQISAGGELE